MRKLIFFNRHTALKIGAIVTLLLSFVVAPSLHANNSELCGAPVDTQSTCENSTTEQDDLTYFTHDMDDYFEPPDAYHIHFYHTSWYPDVTRGDPTYRTYWIVDNHQGGQVIKIIDDHYGKHLTDYSLITTSTDVTAEYYPQDEPASTLEILNSRPGYCGIWCQIYSQANWFYVQ